MTSFSPARWLAVAAVSLLVSACATTQVSTKAGSLETHVEPDQQLITHLVGKGQTLYRIARAYGLTVEELMDANRIDDPRDLKAGELLYVPGAKER